MPLLSFRGMSCESASLSGRRAVRGDGRLEPWREKPVNGEASGRAPRAAHRRLYTMHPTHSPTGRWPDQRETALFDDTYQLPAPQTTELATLRDVGGGPITVGAPAGFAPEGREKGPRQPRNVADRLLMVLWHQKWLVAVVMLAGLI